DELQAAAYDLESRGVQVEPVVADFTDASDVDKVINVATDRFGPIDIPINNAGTAGQNGTLEDTPIEEWRDLFEINLFAVVAITKQVIPYMKKQGKGRIINVSSENGVQPYPDMMNYNAAKAALTNLSKAHSERYANDVI